KPETVVARRMAGGRVLSADCPWGGVIDYFAAKYAPEPSCPAPRAAEPEFIDPTPELPGRPVFPGQKRVPRPEDFVQPQAAAPAPAQEDGRKRKP
ncbi:MAG TPA: hypothetical protein VHS32_20845, partial [Streptosporangiaceae bacterium]|nr:hypothetical protein [Streptosporangiaceae bacterium]